MHAGNICPACQADIVAGDLVVLCDDCGSLSHSRCWEADNCRSFHCSPAPALAEGSGFQENRKPDLVITKDESRRVVMPGRGRLFTTESLAREVSGKERTVTLPAIIGLVSGIFCFFLSMRLTSGIGPLDDVEGFLFLGVILGGVLTTILCVIALASMPPSSGWRGSLVSLAGLLTGAFAMVLAVYSAAVRNDEKEMAPVQFQAEQVKDFVNRATPAIRGPLIANVHVSVTRSLGNEFRGSGVALKAIGSDTYIISNLHVLTGGRAVTDLATLRQAGRPVVTFYSGEQKPAEVVWLAPDGIDIVLMKVSSPENIVFATKILAGNLLSIGQKVFAIGNPMGLNWSYTEGVVSGIRSHQFGTRQLSVIQMQTPLNPGNSGGGLYDQDGRLVGINTWIYAKSRSEGLNFSIDINDLINIIEPPYSDYLQVTKN
jgi:S1-C subfamily serine protease